MRTGSSQSRGTWDKNSGRSWQCAQTGCWTLVCGAGRGLRAHHHLDPGPQRRGKLEREGLAGASTGLGRGQGTGACTSQAQLHVQPRFSADRWADPLPGGEGQGPPLGETHQGAQNCDVKTLSHRYHGQRGSPFIPHDSCRPVIQHLLRAWYWPHQGQEEQTRALF